MQKFNIKPLSLVIIAAALSGCAATREANHHYQDAADAAVKNLNAGRNLSANEGNGDQLANFARVQKNWVNPVPIHRNPEAVMRASLPPFFKDEVSETMPGRVSLVEVISEIQRAQHIHFDINQDIYNVSTKAGNVVGAGSTSDSTTAVVPLYVNDFVYRGSLENALDLLASKANISWKWNGSSVEVFKYETKSYNIAALAGETNSTSQVQLQSDSSKDQSSSTTATNAPAGSTGAGGAGGGSSTQNQALSGSSTSQGVTRTATLKSWDDIKNYLLSMLSPQGSMAVMESAGLIEVKDTPAVQRQVATAVKDLNALLGKQIYMDVDVYAVTKDSADNYGIDWNVAWATIGSGLSFGYTSAASGASGSAFTAGVTSGPLKGTKVVLQALSTLGKASVVNQFSLTTLNGQPTPLGNNRKIGYVQSVSVVQDLNGNPTTSITAGSVFQGIGMSLIPKVQPNGKILLEYALNLSDVEGITNFSTGGNTIQLPTTTLKNILQRASLRSGQTLVLSGFKQTTAKANNNGVISPNNPLFGGSAISSNEDQYLVITVTPYVSQDNDD